MMNRRQEEREYEDFTPSTAWTRELEYDTLIVFLSGFKKEQLKVQVTTLRNLRISGERPLGNNKWSRFSLEFPIPANYDPNEITAKFEGSSLYIKHPRIITAEDPQQIEEQKAKEEKATTTQKVPSKTSMEKPKAGEEEARMQKVPSKTSMEKQKSKEEKQEVPTKTSSNEKQPTEKATDSADDLSYKEANEKSLEKKESEDSDRDDEKTSGAAMEMDKPGLEGLSQVGGGGLVTMVKQTGKLLDFVVALLIALAVGIYNCVRNAIRLIGKSDN